MLENKQINWRETIIGNMAYPSKSLYLGICWSLFCVKKGIFDTSEMRFSRLKVDFQASEMRFARLKCIFFFQK